MNEIYWHQIHHLSSYTTDGNYDLVGNNLPVFFIRDGIKFPDMVHAFKPSPVSDMISDTC